MNSLESVDTFGWQSELIKGGDADHLAITRSQIFEELQRRGGWRDHRVVPRGTEIH